MCTLNIYIVSCRYRTFKVGLVSSAVMSNAEKGPSSEGEVMEGFICPFCLLAFPSITQLQAHFEEQHASEDKAVLQSLKGNPLLYSAKVTLLQCC